MTIREQIAALVVEIASLDEVAWGCEDREQYRQASAFRAKARKLQMQLDALIVAGRSEVQS